MPVNKNILKDESLMKESSDTVMIANRIKLLIAGKKDGIYSTIIEKQYEKKYREKLPSQWWRKSKIMNVLQVEPLSAESNVMIIFPTLSLDELEPNLRIKEEQKMSSLAASLKSINMFNGALKTDNHQAVEAEEEIFDESPPTLSLPNDAFWDVFIISVASAQEVYLRFIGDEYSDVNRVRGQVVD